MEQDGQEVGERSGDEGPEAPVPSPKEGGHGTLATPQPGALEKPKAGPLERPGAGALERPGAGALASPEPAPLEAPEPSGSWDFDVSAALLGQDAGDVDRLFDVLGDKLVRVLGSRVQVEHRRGLLRRGQELQRIVVDAGGQRLEARRERSGPVFAMARQVRGITLNTTTVPADQWLQMLTEFVEKESEQSSEVKLALGRLLEQ